MVLWVPHTGDDETYPTSDSDLHGQIRSLFVGTSLPLVRVWLTSV